MSFARRCSCAPRHVHGARSVMMGAAPTTAADRGRSTAMGRYEEPASASVPTRWRFPPRGPADDRGTRSESAEVGDDHCQGTRRRQSSCHALQRPGRRSHSDRRCSAHSRRRRQPPTPSARSSLAIQSPSEPPIRINEPSVGGKAFDDPLLRGQPPPRRAGSSAARRRPQCCPGARCQSRECTPPGSSFLSASSLAGPLRAPAIRPTVAVRVSDRRSRRRARLTDHVCDRDPLNRALIGAVSVSTASPHGRKNFERHATARRRAIPAAGTAPAPRRPCLRALSTRPLPRRRAAQDSMTLGRAPIAAATEPPRSRCASHASRQQELVVRQCCCGCSRGFAATIDRAQASSRRVAFRGHGSLRLVAGRVSLPSSASSARGPEASSASMPEPEPYPGAPPASADARARPTSGP